MLKTGFVFCFFLVFLVFWCSKVDVFGNRFHLFPFCNILSKFTKNKNGNCYHRNLLTIISIKTTTTIRQSLLACYSESCLCACVLAMQTYLDNNKDFFASKLFAFVGRKHKKIELLTLLLYHIRMMLILFSECGVNKNIYMQIYKVVFGFNAFS